MPEQIPQADIVTALNEADMVALQEWTNNHEDLDVAHLKGLGELASLREARVTYGVGISTEHVDDERGIPRGFVVLTGPDAGTVIKNTPDTYKSLGLPETGPVAAYDAIPDELKGGGVVKNFNPYFRQEVRVRRTNGDIDDGWRVKDIGDDGRAFAVKQTPEGELRKRVKPEDIYPVIEQSAAPSVIQEKPVASPEEHRQARIEQLFVLPTSDQLKDSGVQKRFSTTEKSIKDAAFAYRFSDDQLRDIFAKYKTANHWRESDMPELARSNNDLRIEIGDYLLQKISSGDTRLAERVYTHYGKTVNHYGYSYVGLMDSKEAVAQIAIAMLDGTYKIEDCTSDPIEMNSWGQAIQGQHRWSAYQILGTPLSAYKQLIRQQ